MKGTSHRSDLHVGKRDGIPEKEVVKCTADGKVQVYQAEPGEKDSRRRAACAKMVWRQEMLKEMQGDPCSWS